MDFERGQDVKEVIKIGRKANAFKIDGLEVLGRIPGQWLEDTPSQYKDLPCDSNKHFRIKAEEEIIKILDMMVQSGISKKLDNYIKKKIIAKHKKEAVKAERHNGISGSVHYYFKETKIDFIHFELEGRDDLLILPRTLGKDVLYKDKLYRIKNEF